MQPSDKAQILKDSPIFSGLNDGELDELSSLAIERSFMPDEFVSADMAAGTVKLF